MVYPKIRWFTPKAYVTSYTDEHTGLLVHGHIVHPPRRLQYQVSDDSGTLTWTDVPEVFENE